MAYSAKYYDKLIKKAKEKHKTALDKSADLKSDVINVKKKYKKELDEIAKAEKDWERADMIRYNAAWAIRRLQTNRHYAFEAKKTAKLKAQQEQTQHKCGCCLHCKH